MCDKQNNFHDFAAAATSIRDEVETIKKYKPEALESAGASPWSMRYCAKTATKEATNLSLRASAGRNSSRTRVRINAFHLIIVT